MLGRIGSIIMGFFRLVAFRLVPLLLVMVIVWTGYQVSEALTRQLDERREYDDNRAVYLEKATEIAIEMSTRNAPSPTATASSTPTPTATATNTATPEPTLTPTLTPEPSLTPIPTETATLTPAPTSTAVPSDTVTATPQPTATPMREAQQATNTPRPAMFATNTPRSVTFATNTPQQSEQDQQPAITVAPTEPPTNTPVDLPTETEAVAEAQPTPANTLPPFYFPRTPEPGTVINGVPVPTEVPLVPREYDLFNVILLGGDGELTDDGSIRTDTMIVVSINKDTNAVSMLSLPRDLYVYVPTENGAMERLNTVYGFGQSIGWQPSAFDLLRQTIAYNFGINVHHYALVNFSGFEEIIDTLGGIDIAVDCAYQDYRLVGAELPEGATQSAEDEDLYTIGVGYYTMNGGQALWYARTRRTATDFDRGRRQQQILRAMYHQALDTGQIRNLPQLWGQVTDVMDTSVDVTDVFGLIPIALNLDAGSIRSYTFSLGYHTQPLTVTGNDGVTANVHVPVYETMRPVLEEFYLPPSNSQIALEGATIAVYNGTGNPQWDLVAAERLGWEGFRSQAMGEGTAEDADGTVLIDHTGQQKGSSLNQIAAILNVSPENIRSEPDANRQADFEVILGADYNSCTYDGILEVPQ